MWTLQMSRHRKSKIGVISDHEENGNKEKNHLKGFTYLTIFLNKSLEYNPVIKI